MAKAIFAHTEKGSLGNDILHGVSGKTGSVARARISGSGGATG